MKEIEKISLEDVPNATAKEATFAIKINEIIDVLNALIITHPKLEESASTRRDFEHHMNKPNEPGQYRANND